MPLQKDNKMARAALRRTKPNAILRDAQPTVDQQLVRLEDDLRRLKIEFEIFFNGATKKPPYDTKGRVETVLKRLGDDRSMSFAQRYLYNSLAARYTAFKEVWRRTMKGREECRENRAHRVFAARSNTIAPTLGSTFVCSDAHNDLDTVRTLYAALIKAKRDCNESVEDLPFPKFHQMIAQRTDSLKEKLNCEQVRFSVSVLDGQVKFKASAFKRQTSDS